MFATKILVASALAAGSMAFTAQSASAATHISVGIGVAPIYYSPAVTYYTPAPVVTYAPAPVCQPAYVPAPVYCQPPVVVYQPDFSFGFGFGGHRDFHDFRDFRHDRR